MIAFIGSVFSPYYARARRVRANADPCDHVALNVALYGVRGPGWAMTERGRGALAVAPDAVRIGPSSVRWDGAALRIAFDEWSVPMPRRLRGSITLHPGVVLHDTYTLDAAGRHRWTPLAPCARVEVALDRPEWAWQGSGYCDSNEGDAPLEQDFASWEWSRAALRDGGCAVVYDGLRSDGSGFALARRFDPNGASCAVPVPPRQRLSRGRWGMARLAHGEPGSTPRLLRGLEDAPFYARSMVTTRVLGETATAMHESLSLRRFSAPWVQALLPFRMPRRAASMVMSSGLN